MGMSLKCTAFYILLGGSHAMAAVLPKDSLLCEGEQQLATLKDAGVVKPGGDAQLKEASLHLQFHELRAKSSKVYSDLAVNEELIRGNRVGGSSSARAVDANAGIANAKSEAENFKKVIGTCATSGPEEIPVEVLKQMPISGATQVRVRFRGVLTDLWTNSKIINSP